MGTEVCGLSVVDARGIDPDGDDVAVVGKPAGRLRSEPGEMELGDGLGAGQSRAEILRTVVPPCTPPCPDQEDRSGGKLSMFRLPRGEILDGDLVVPVHPVGDVHDGGSPDKTRERDLVIRPPVLGEVDRRIEVRPAVLGRTEVVGRIEPSSLRGTVRLFIEHESRCIGRPVDRRRRERVREVDPATLGGVEDGGVVRPDRRARRKEVGHHDHDRAREHQAKSGSGHHGSWPFGIHGAGVRTIGSDLRRQKSTAPHACACRALPECCCPPEVVDWTPRWREPLLPVQIWTLP